MNPRLARITNWAVVARRAHWSAGAMARGCGVSLRTLERHCARRMGKKLRDWLLEERMATASVMLREGLSVKETAFQLSYRSVEAFARRFKKRYGHWPKLHGGVGAAESARGREAGMEVRDPVAAKESWGEREAGEFLSGGGCSGV